MFDLDDVDAAFDELDARYVAGEAAANSRTWSVIATAYAGLSHQTLPATTPDFQDADHRHAIPFAPGDLFEYLRAAWALGVDASTYIDAVHRLSDFGAVVTHTARGTSHEGSDFEWREINLVTIEGDRFTRSELFDEADLDAALARFEQLRPRPHRLTNAASQVADRFSTHFATGDWGAVVETLANDISTDDRRRVVGAGLRQGRDAVMAELSAVTEIGVKSATSDTIATRGEHLVLSRARTWGDDQRPETFLTEMLSIIEINAHERIVWLVTFDPDDFEAAIAELDARYLAGEAAAHAHSWSVVAGAYAGLNRHEFPATTPDWLNIDHRGETAFGASDLNAYLRTGLDHDQDINIYIEAVHQLTELGAVVTYAADETSQDGFDAEWRGITMLTLDGDMVNRCEVFDEADLDAALAKFEQLGRSTPKLENAATQAAERFLATFAARDWNAMAELVAEDFSSDDRRAVIGAGVRHGADAVVAEMRANADLWIAKGTFTVIATRGDRLGLSHARFTGSDQDPQAFVVETLAVGEINGDGRIVAFVTFDLDDFESAIAELEARYLAGEASPYARTWSVIAEARAALTRHELPRTTPDWVNIDHRRGIASRRAI